MDGDNQPVCIHPMDRFPRHMTPAKLQLTVGYPGRSARGIDMNAQSEVDRAFLSKFTIVLCSAWLQSPNIVSVAYGLSCGYSAYISCALLPGIALQSSTIRSLAGSLRIRSYCRTVCPGRVLPRTIDTRRYMVPRTDGKPHVAAHRGTLCALMIGEKRMPTAPFRACVTVGYLSYY